MDSRRLKLFDPNSESLSSAQRGAAAANPQVTLTRVVGEARVAVSVSDLLPLLADAWNSRRAWLNDFSTDRVIVSQDLYEVLLAYKRLRQEQAA
jgi:hypothetical protein